MKRTALVAPLVVPLIMAVYAMYMVHVEINRPGWHTLDTGAVLQAIAWVAFFPAIYAYVGVILFGVPAYRFLTARKLTAFWIAPVVGPLRGHSDAADVWCHPGRTHRRSAWGSRWDGTLADRPAGSSDTVTPSPPIELWSHRLRHRRDSEVDGARAGSRGRSASSG